MAAPHNCGWKRSLACRVSAVVPCGGQKSKPLRSCGPCRPRHALPCVFWGASLFRSTRANASPAQHLLEEFLLHIVGSAIGGRSRAHKVSARVPGRGAQLGLDHRRRQGADVWSAAPERGVRAPTSEAEQRTLLGAQLPPSAQLLCATGIGKALRTLPRQRGPCRSVFGAAGGTLNAR